MKFTIIEFSVENFQIFKEKVTFSMLARKSNSTFENNGKNLLRTSLIYGPNATGKSTLLHAFNVIKKGIIYSANNPEGSTLPYHPFILSNVSNRPSFYEVVFSLDNKIFRYNFSILKMKVIAENLFEITPSLVEKEYLIRNEQKIKLYNDFKGSRDVADVKTRKEVLFLSAASQWNNKLAMKIAEGFKNVSIISGQNSEHYGQHTVKLFKESQEKKIKILDLLKKADFCIEDGAVEKVVLPDFIKKQIKSKIKGIPDEVDTIYFSHSKFDANNNKIGTERFNIGDESDGTQKFFDVLGPVIDTLEKGKVLFIDEFDNSLHPILTKFIVDLFEKSNPNNAQLIATTHDTSLLSYKDFIKDNFWFTEKNEFGAGSLFSLAEFDLRNDTEYSKKYLEGRFGGLPFVQSL